MENQDADRSVQKHIEKLVGEEHRLFEKQSSLSNEEHQRLQDIKIELDQCWDLLRQRRALREFGEDPDKARVRPKEIVENYEQ